MKNWRLQLHIGWRTEIEDKLTYHIADRLIEARKKMRLSQRQLSELLGRSNAYISQIEAGRLDVRVIDLIGIAWLLDKPISYFIPDYEKRQGKLDGEERELIQQFRDIKDPEIRKLALKQFSQFAGVKLNPQPSRKRQTRKHSTN